MMISGRRLTACSAMRAMMKARGNFFAILERRKPFAAVEPSVAALAAPAIERDGSPTFVAPTHAIPIGRERAACDLA